MEFILSDDSVNKYGFRVLTSGLDITDFEKNPVMLYNHQRTGQFDTVRLMPIGKWDKIRKENGKLIAEAVFDENDEFAIQVKEKVEKGILNAASLGFNVVAISEDAAMMLPGQTRPTVTQAKVSEASIVDIPGNSNALKMSFKEGALTLAGDFDTDTLNLVLPTLQTFDMKQIALTLGLAADATEDQILAAVKTLKEQATHTLSALTDGVITLGKAKGVINDKNEAHFKKLATADLNATLSLISEQPAPAATAPEQAAEVKPDAPKHESLVDAIKLLAGQSASTDGSEDRSKWTLTDWRKNDPKGLEKLRSEKPQEFEKLVAPIKHLA